MAEPAIPPRTPGARRELAREADALLRAAFHDLGKNGIGHPDLSLDVMFRTLPAPEPWTPPVDAAELDAVLESCTEAGLTPREMDLTRGVAAGDVVPGVRGSRSGLGPVCVRLGVTKPTARMAWMRAKRKLRASWAEPRRQPQPRLRAGIVGAGFPVRVGAPRNWGRIVDPEHARDAMARHRDRIKDSDWSYAPSLRPDGWQLGDDRVWSS